MNSELTATLEEKYPAPPDPTPMKVAFQRLYRLMDWIQSAESDGEQDTRLKEANVILHMEGAEIMLRFSTARDEYGNREIFMTHGKGGGINASEFRRQGPPSWELPPAEND
ncbi:hypothetical protein Salmuc_02770 [Salipiger mucosus DSM 16094]|uniref:Uncharacterized protein n=1 Tax=Salipiger mucosus DSM 16094 TaxID=1123237 RepID=S9S5C3_9RHOB|nr:hypothetical protein Salmuc_02770 [Salipiger mucosus DSM 16094]